MRQLYPDQSDDLDPTSIYAGLDWAPRPDRPHVALNMVSSVDGRAALHGSATGIGSGTDHLLLMALRSNADALLLGAGTLRSDRVGKGVPAAWVPRRRERGLAPQPILAVLTASGDVPLERAFFAEPERAAVFVAAQTASETQARLAQRARVFVAGEERPDPAEAIRVLQQEYGVRHVLCEGGPSLNRSLLAAGVLDELFLTLAPKLLAGDGLPLVAGSALDPPVPLHLLTLYEHESELYLRYRVTVAE
jgi:riboflavin biosynthesis pyrimidine reductase